VLFVSLDSDLTLLILLKLFSTVPGLRDMLLNSSPQTADKQIEYDPRKREPQFAHASSSAIWELVRQFSPFSESFTYDMHHQIPLTHHYHPTVSLHARQLLSSQPLTASADLSLNTLSHFLDRFVYKNPKKSTNSKSKGASVMQPAASSVDGTGVKLMKGDVLGGALAPVNEETFWKKRAEDVPVDQACLRYRCM
jgi:ribosome biogenesis protein MAK21